MERIASLILFISFFSREGVMTNYMNVEDGGGRTVKVPVDYPSNAKSDKGKIPQREKPQKVVTGDIVQRKPSLGRRIRSSFVRDDEQGIPEMIIMDIMVPLAKDMLANSFTAIFDGLNLGVQRAIFGEAVTRTSSSRPGAFYTNYNKVRQAPPGLSAYRAIDQRGRERHDFNGVVFGTRGDAEEVLDGLRELISKYGTASVEEFYDLCGIPGEYTGNKWGWTDLRSAGVRLVRGGWIVDLPRTEPID